MGEGGTAAPRPQVLRAARLPKCGNLSRSHLPTDASLPALARSRALLLSLAALLTAICAP